MFSKEKHETNSQNTDMVMIHGDVNDDVEGNDEVRGSQPITATCEKDDMEVQ